jgi:hypothetical protein
MLPCPFVIVVSGGYSKNTTDHMVGISKVSDPGARLVTPQRGKIS